MHKLMDNAEFKKLAIETRDCLAAKQHKVEKPVIPASFTGGERWYCVYTAQWCEFQALRAIRALDIRAYLPVETLWVRHHLKRGEKATQTKERALFPRYLFVSLDNAVLQECASAINVARGVEELVCAKWSDARDIPVRVPEEFIALLIAQEASGMFDETRPTDECPFVEGQAVGVYGGPFAGFNAEFRGWTPNHRAEVLLEALGRVATVKLPIEFLGKPR